MKIFTKTALACALAAGAVMASADTVEIRDGNNQVVVTYSADAVTVQNGIISLSNGIYSSGQLPGSGGPGVICDPLTTEPVNGVCVGTSGGNGEDFCGSGTSWSGTLEQCIVVGPAPTLNITSNDNLLTVGETATLTFTFSETVTGFTMSDINATNGSIGNFNGNGSSYTARFTPTPNFNGSSTISVNGSGYQDADGQTGSSDTLSLTLQGDPNSCQVPTGVQVSNVEALTAFGTSGGQIDFTIPQTGVLSAPISTGNNPNYTAMFEMVGHYTVQSLTRKMWISECPGGAPVKSCAQKSGADLSWRWTQGANYWGYCALETNKDYYLNVQNASPCPYSGGCRATTQHKSSDQQNL